MQKAGNLYQHSMLSHEHTQEFYTLGDGMLVDDVALFDELSLPVLFNHQ